MIRKLLRDERGYSLIELLIVMAILGIVLGALTTVFVSGSNAELDLNRQFQAQQAARLALDKIRVDIHCASTAQAQAQTIGTYPGLKLAFPSGGCYPTTVSWCAVPSATITGRFALYRSTATSNICTSSDTTRLLVADDLTRNTNVFTTGTIPYLGLETVAVDFPVSVNAMPTKDLYELKDSIVARNFSPRCTTVAGCPAPTVS